MTTTDTTTTEPTDLDTTAETEIGTDEHLEVQAPQHEPAPEPAGDADEHDADEHEGGKANREAARYRTRARDAEAKLEALTAQHDALLRSVIETSLPRDVPAAVFWKFQDGTDGLLDDNGLPSHDAITERARAVFDEAGLKPVRGPIVPTAGDRPERVSMSTWADVLTNRIDY